MAIKETALVPMERIEQAILLIRGQRVMLDADLAELYEVETGKLVRAVKRNIERFPVDFMFQLTQEEFRTLRYQFGISKTATDRSKARDGRGGRRYPPYAFTEQGVAMLSSVLRSKRAVQVNVEAGSCNLRRACGRLSTLGRPCHPVTSSIAEEAARMTRYVIGPDVAIRLAHDDVVIPDQHQLLAPTLLRTQVLSLLYRAVRHGEMTRKDANRKLNYVRGLRIRLLGDRSLQDAAWKIADKLGWPDTIDAEYVALTQLQGDAFITLDAELAHAVKGLVPVAPIETLST